MIRQSGSISVMPAQKDTFIQNYKQRFINFLENRFILQEIDIETAVDISETNDILYTDEQKYNYLFGKYPVLKEMKKNLILILPEIT